MSLRLSSILLACAALLPATAATPLPSNSFATALQTDASGNLYLSGYTLSNPADSSAPAHVLVLKLSPDGTQVLWRTTLAGSKDDRAETVALGPGNTVVVTGTTQSVDFPVSKGAYANAGGAFAAKLDANGAVVYSTYLPAITAQGLTVDAAGDAFITGLVEATDGFAVTAGTVTGVPFTSTNGQTGYVLELDPAGGHALLALLGFGGSLVARDAQGNIYAAGHPTVAGAPTTAGAFQSSVTPRSCASLGFFGVFFCDFQYIAKIDSTGTKLIYATYLAGTWGATPGGMAVDSAGEVIVAGSTSSPDYPTTGAAYQPIYYPNPAPQEAAMDLTGPPTTGYVSKLNASGTGLVWSTFLGGSAVGEGSFLAGDTVSALAVDASGNIVISGLAASTDFPGVWNVPVASRPAPSNPGHPLAFVARLSADGGTLSPVQFVSGAPMAVRPDGSVVAAGTEVETLSFAALGRVTMIADPADNAKVVSVAPGQLLTLYGTNLAPQGIAAGAGGYPTAFNGVTVTFNGIAAPILYTAGNQINLEVPYEIAGESQVTMQVSSGLVSPAIAESYLLAVTTRQPGIFLSGASFSAPLFDIASCNGQSVAGLLPLALNADGTANSCANPAAPGSSVTIFLNGLGVTSPAQVSGAISQSTVALSPAAVSTAGVLSTSTFAGFLADVVQVQVAAPATTSAIALQVGDFGVRGPGAVIWVAAH